MRVKMIKSSVTSDRKSFDRRGSSPRIFSRIFSGALAFALGASAGAWLLDARLAIGPFVLEAPIAAAPQAAPALTMAENPSGAPLEAAPSLAPAPAAPTIVARAHNVAKALAPTSAKAAFAWATAPTPFGGPLRHGFAPDAAPVVLALGPSPRAKFELIAPPLSAPVAEAENAAPAPKPAVAQVAESAPLPPPRPPEFSAAAPASPPVAIRRLARHLGAASVPVADNRTFFQKLFGAGPASAPAPAAAYAAPETSVVAATHASSSRYDQYTAVYDIAAHTVYMPGGERLEAHSGLGDRLDDPRHVNERMLGATPPSLYELTPREQLFHGVAALRLNPVGNSPLFGRAGLLAHSYMLGPNGDSNGCVSFKDYDAFLQAFHSGRVKRLAVVARLE